ncbi:MAG: repeat, subgroup [Gemmataceae bacterium]|nr:repeat, subgroup [Gemmataceae bacterium]
MSRPARSVILFPELPVVPTALIPFRDGKRALAGNTSLLTLDLEKRTMQRSTPPTSVGWNALAVGLSRDEKLALSGGMDNAVTLWTLETGEVKRSFQAVRTSQSRSLAFFPDGTRALSASIDGTARVWGVETGQPLLTFGRHRAGIQAATILADGRHVVSGGRDRTLRVWDATTGNPVARHDQGPRGHPGRSHSGVLLRGRVRHPGAGRPVGPGMAGHGSAPAGRATLPTRRTVARVPWADFPLLYQLSPGDRAIRARILTGAKLGPAIKDLITIVSPQTFARGIAVVPVHRSAHHVRKTRSRTGRPNHCCFRSLGQ